MTRRKKKVEKKPEPEPKKELYSTLNTIDGYGQYWLVGVGIKEATAGRRTARYILVDMGTITQKYEPDNSGDV